MPQIGRGYLDVGEQGLLRVVANGKAVRTISSVSSEAKKLSVTALSKHDPVRPVEGRMPASSHR
jgi:hypothetical protein